jgi:DNA-binding winged helix-turn-helix (wHTH) protein
MVLFVIFQPDIWRTVRQIDDYGRSILLERNNRGLLMRYILCDQVIFEPESNALYTVDNCEEVVTISNPARRLLELLILHQGESVRREEIFHKVWDEFGMVSSNNNLNHCVSKLRRMLRDFGIEDDVIITIPKLGFLLHKDISVCAVSDDGSAMPVFARLPASAIDGPEAPQVKHRIPYLRICFALCVGVVILLSMLCFGMLFYPHAENDIELGRVEGCNVLFYGENMDADKRRLIKQSVQHHIDRRAVTCRDGEYLLVYPQDKGPHLPQNAIRLHITHCALQQNSQTEVCSDI